VSNDTNEDQAVQQECGGCNTEAGEECRPTCTGQAVHVEVSDGSLADLFGDNAISVYSRADALADGALVGVPEELAREVGFVWPVALTAAVWADCVAWTEDTEAGKSSGTGQDETGRLWDVLWMARWAVRKAGPDVSRTSFSVLRVPPTGPQVAPRAVTLSLQVEPGDEGEPVVTICEPGED